MSAQSTSRRTKHVSDRERLHEIVDALAPGQIRALLTLLDSLPPLSDHDFAQRLANAPEEELDEATAAAILSAEAEPGEVLSHHDLKQHLGL